MKRVTGNHYRNSRNGMDMQIMIMNRTLGMIKNDDFLSKCIRNKFVLKISTKKRNEKEWLFLMNGKLL